ncbi:MAG: hypothetical protein PHT54_04465 [Candidatus Nanoarchaeia archaeon]|nr:hypothetical protein [Candidatus Nanoarchaeia archaeon]
MIEEFSRLYTPDPDEFLALKMETFVLNPGFSEESIRAFGSEAYKEIASLIKNYRPRVLVDIHNSSGVQEAKGYVNWKGYRVYLTFSQPVWIFYLNPKVDLKFRDDLLESELFNTVSTVVCAEMSDYNPLMKELSKPAIKIANKYDVRFLGMEVFLQGEKGVRFFGRNRALLDTPMNKSIIESSAEFLNQLYVYTDRYL